MSVSSRVTITQKGRRQGELYQTDSDLVERQPRPRTPRALVREEAAELERSVEPHESLVGVFFCFRECAFCSEGPGAAAEQTRTWPRLKRW